MNSLNIGLLAIGTYLGSAGLLIQDTVRNQSRRLPLYIAWLAIAGHSATFGILCRQYGGFNFSFFNIASLIACIVSALLLIASLNKPVEKLGIAVFPLAALMIGLTLLYPGTSFTSQNYSWEMHIHILTSIIAFSLLNIAALQAILLAIHERLLRKHPPKPLILRLPALQTMESLLFQMISTGLFFLSISLVSGFIFIEDLFAQHLAHKTVLSILAWLIFSGLLFGRIRYGWRGKTATKWTLIGFVLLLLAYFGSKLVLELILHRT